MKQTYEELRLTVDRRLAREYWRQRVLGVLNTNVPITLRLSKSEAKATGATLRTGEHYVFSIDQARDTGDAVARVMPGEGLEYFEGFSTGALAYVAEHADEYEVVARNKATRTERAHVPGTPITYDEDAVILKRGAREAKANAAKELARAERVYLNRDFALVNFAGVKEETAELARFTRDVFASAPKAPVTFAEVAGRWQAECADARKRAQEAIDNARARMEACAAVEHAALNAGGWELLAAKVLAEIELAEKESKP